MSDTRPSGTGFAELPDIHICGACHAQFQDIDTFVLHKHQNCPVKSPTQDGASGRTKTATLHGEGKAERIVEMGPSIVGETYTGGNSLEEVVAGLPREVTQPCVQPSDVFKQQQTVSMLPMQAATATSPENINLLTEGLVEQQNVHPLVISSMGSVVSLQGLQTQTATDCHSALAGMLALNPAPADGTMDVEVLQQNNLTADQVTTGQQGANAELLIKAVLTNNNLAQNLAKVTYALANQPPAVKKQKMGQYADLLPKNTSGIPEIIAASVDKRLSCPYDNCQYSTVYGKDLERHKRVHTGERPFVCEYCQRAFSRGDKLKIHIRGHLGNKPYKCDQCDYAAGDSSSLKKHKRIHSDERPYKCQICTYASRNSSQLIVHLRTHTGDSPYVCTVCNYRFKINSDLKRHMRIHTGEKPFKCDYCDFRCSIKGNLNSHVKINHSEDSLKKCAKCDFKTSSKKTLREHHKVHQEDHTVSCPACDFTCTNKSQLKCHQRVHEQDKPFTCTECDYTCSWKSNMQAHVKRKHESTARKTSRRIKEKHPDIEVPKGMKPRSQLLINRRPFQCPHCELNFVREDSLKSHIKYHSDVENSTYNTALAVLELQNPVMMTNKERQSKRVNKEHNYGQNTTEPDEAKQQGVGQNETTDDEDEIVEVEEAEIQPEQIKIVAKHKTEPSMKVLKAMETPRQKTLRMMKEKPSSRSTGKQEPIIMSSMTSQALNIVPMTSQPINVPTMTSQTLNVPTVTSQAVNVTALNAQMLNVPSLTTRDLYEQLNGTKEGHAPNIPMMSPPGSVATSITTQSPVSVSVAAPGSVVVQPANPTVSFPAQGVGSFTVGPQQQVINLAQLGGQTLQTAQLTPQGVAGNNLVQFQNVQLVSGQQGAVPLVQTTAGGLQTLQGGAQPMIILQAAVNGDKEQAVAVPLTSLSSLEYPQGMVVQLPSPILHNQPTKVVPMQIYKNQQPGDKGGMQLFELEVSTVDMAQIEDPACRNVTENKT